MSSHSSFRIRSQKNIMTKKQIRWVLVIPLLLVDLVRKSIQAQESIAETNPAAFHIVRDIEVETKNRNDFVKAVDDKTSKFNAANER